MNEKESSGLTELDSADAGPRSSNKSPYDFPLHGLGGCFLFISRLFPNTDLSSSFFKGNFVHCQFHQMDAAPVFGFKVFDRERIRNSIGVETISLISDDNEHSLGALAAATHVN